MKKVEVQEIIESLYDYLTDWEFDKTDLINALRKLADKFEEEMTSKS